MIEAIIERNLKWEKNEQMNKVGQAWKTSIYLKVQQWKKTNAKNNTCFVFLKENIKLYNTAKLLGDQYIQHHSLGYHPPRSFCFVAFLQVFNDVVM